MKPHKHAVALVIKDAHDNFLVVKRPDNPEDNLRNVWGFPAATLKDGESEIDGANRVAGSKLGITVHLGEKLGSATQDRGSYTLTLSDYEATVSQGVPTVPQADTSVTQYAACKFTSDSACLHEAAQKGSLCTAIFLDKLGAEWRSAP